MSKKIPDSKRKIPENDQQVVPTETQAKARRRLIQALALGGGIATSKLVPGSWTTPHVKSVLLPAHAAGSRCSLTLGNTTPVNLLVQGDREPAGPGGPESIAEKLARKIVPEAVAGDDPPIMIELTGCFWINFLCNDPGGELCATAVTFVEGGDGAAPDDSPICVPFTFGVELTLEGFCILITNNNNGTATMVISDSGCADSTEPIPLVPNFNCIPLATDT